MSNLILTICSNHKTPGEDAARPAEDEATEYSGAHSMATLLPEMAGEIYFVRKKAFRRIKETGAKRDGILLRDMPYNKDLKKGIDIVGKNREEQGGFYMPAWQRYTGRFYKAFHNATSHKQAKVCLGKESGDYLLIISGLYGVLTPYEFIQGYSCNVQDDMVIRKCWKEGKEEKGGLLTRILLAFIEKFEVSRVFDLMADDAYRHLVEWKLIESKCKIFYSHSKQQKGADMLPELGYVAGRLLSSQGEKKLSNIRFGDVVDGIEFNDTPPEWIPGGAVSQKWTSFAAWAVSMTTNIECFLIKAGVAKRDGAGNVDLFSSIENLNTRKSVTDAMHKIRRFRNEVIHQNYSPDSKGKDLIRVRRIRDYYKTTEKWAVKNCCSDHPKLKDVDY